jgi:hypothetical protein
MGLSSVNMGALLQKKYSILQQEADARTTEANARAVGAQRPLVADNSIAGGAGGGAGLDIPDPAQAELDRQLRQAQIGAANAEARKANTDSSIAESSYYDQKRGTNSAYNSGTPDSIQARLLTAEKAGLTGEALYEFVRTGKLPGLKRGLTKVPGKGTKDKFPAMLAPGEAVLNANAAKKLGRGLIAHLNAYGNAKAAKKGMV